MVKQNNSFGVASLILGIIGILIVPYLCSILAIIFGGVGMNRKQKYSVAGLVLGIIGLFTGIMLIGLYIGFIGSQLAAAS